MLGVRRRPLEAGLIRRGADRLARAGRSSRSLGVQSSANPNFLLISLHHLYGFLSDYIYSRQKCEIRGVVVDTENNSRRCRTYALNG